MRAGILTETILLQESVPIKNEFGATSMEWVDYLQTRANIKFNSGNRVNQNNEIFTSYTLTFTIRYYHKAVSYTHLTLKYRILAINSNRTKQSTEIIGELINE